MLARQHARGTGVVAADLPLRQLVKQPLPLVIQRLHLRDLAAKIAQVSHPVAGIERQLRIDLLAQPLGERRACSGGRNSDLKITAPNDGRKVEVAKWRVVDCVANDIFLSGFAIDRPVDSGTVRRCDDQKMPGQVAFRDTRVVSIRSRLQQPDRRCADGPQARSPSPSHVPPATIRSSIPQGSPRR